jgi:hypothetical protein
MIAACVAATISFAMYTDYGFSGMCFPDKASCEQTIIEFLNSDWKIATQTYHSGAICVEQPAVSGTGTVEWTGDVHWGDPLEK